MVDLDIEGRVVVETIGMNLGEGRIRARHLQQLAPCRHQRVVTETGAILELQIEAAGDAEFRDRGRVDGEDCRTLDSREIGHRSSHQRLDLQILGFAHLPILEAREHDAGILGAAGEAEPGNAERGFDHLAFVFAEMFRDLSNDALGPLQGRPGGVWISTSIKP